MTGSTLEDSRQSNTDNNSSSRTTTILRWLVWLLAFGLVGLQVAVLIIPFVMGAPVPSAWVWPKVSFSAFNITIEYETSSSGIAGIAISWLAFLPGVCALLLGLVAMSLGRPNRSQPGAASSP